MRIIPILIFAVVMALIPMTAAASPYLNITSAPDTETLTPKGELSFLITVKNKGSSYADASISFPIENGTGSRGEDELPRGIHVVNKSSIKRVDVLSSATFNVTLGADDEVSAGVYTVTLAAIAAGSPNAIHNLTIIVPRSGNRAPTPRAHATPTEGIPGTSKPVPGFEPIFAIAGVLLIVLINRWK